MKGWRKFRLGDGCITNANSYTPKEKWKFVNYLDTGNITDNKINAIQYIDIENEKLPSRARRKVQENSIIYSTVRPKQRHFGIIKNQPDNFLVSTGFVVIDVNESILDADFLYYLLTQNKVVEKLHIIAEQSVSTYPSIKPLDIENLEISIPDIVVQKRIASILGCLDKKIEQNNMINKNLLQQAGAVFDKFYEESPNQQSFTSFIRVLGGGTPKTGNSDFWNGPIPFFTPKDVGVPYTFQTEKHITEYGLAHCNSRLYQKDTTFVTARGTVGKVSLAGTPMAMNQSCYALVSDVTDPLLVYFYVLKAVASLKHKASGAVFDAIVTRDFDSETINLLSNNDSKSVLSIIRPMMEAIHNNSKENIRLVAFRDSLLPRLMLGKLDVSKVDL